MVDKVRVDELVHPVQLAGVDHLFDESPEDNLVVLCRHTDLLPWSGLFFCCAFFKWPPMTCHWCLGRCHRYHHWFVTGLTSSVRALFRPEPARTRLTLRAVCSR